MLKHLRRAKRIGLVLGAGGPVGHAYHAGVLQALSDVVGWDARDAEVVVGTSAGAQVGALLRAGMTPKDLAARAKGAAMTSEGEQIARHWVRPCHKTPDPSLPKSSRPAAPRFLLEALRRPDRFRPGRLVSAMLPAGRVKLDAQSAGLRNVFGDRWPDQHLWITSVHLDSGERVAFGSPGAPTIDVGTAVSCSGAVPGVHAPVQWDGRRYVDGGMASATHLDLLHKNKLDLVVVSSPLSMFGAMSALFRREVNKLSKYVPVLVFEPKEEALAAMGRNPMDLTRAPGVAHATHQATSRALTKLLD